MAEKSARLTESSSLVLDIVRFGAAVAVFVGHVTVPCFLTQFPDIHVIGEFAVPVFFVLSGFVIRFVTLRRSLNLRDYLIDRAARIYSVALPAMLLTLLLAGVCLRLNRDYYVLNFGGFSNHVVLRVLMNLVFLSQAWGLNTIPLIDGPFWSLGYECSYYVGFGLFLYLRGRRRALALLLWALIAGPQVLFLAPVWLLGCLVFDLYQSIRQTTFALVLETGALLWIALALVLCAFGHGAVLLAPFHLVQRMGQLPNPLELLHLPPRRATMLATAIGILTSVLLLITLLIADRVRLESRSKGLMRFRRIADGTFALYLMHYPMLAFATAAGLLRPHSLWRNVTAAAVICAALIAIAYPLDRLKVFLRTMLRSLVPLSTTERIEPRTAAHDSAASPGTP